MKQLLTNPVMVNIELSLCEDLIKLIAGAIHPQAMGGQVHNIITRLLSLREQALTNGGGDTLESGNSPMEEAVK